MPNFQAIKISRKHLNDITIRNRSLFWISNKIPSENLKPKKIFPSSVSLEIRTTLQTTKKELKVWKTALFHVYPFVPLDFLYLLCYLYFHLMFWAIIFLCFTQFEIDCSLEFRYISWHKTLLACVQLSPPLSDFFWGEGAAVHRLSSFNLMLVRLKRNHARGYGGGH